MSLPRPARTAAAVLSGLLVVGAASPLIAAPASAALPTLAPAAAPDLSTYHLVGRYALPSPATATPPNATSLLAQEASAVTYDWDTGTLFVVGDGGTSVVQVSTTGALIDSMTLAPGSSPQGTEFYDTEALTYVGDGRFVLGEERYRQVDLFTYAAGTTLTRADVRTVKLGSTIGNTGLEGVGYDPLSATGAGVGLLGVKEIDPKGIFATSVDFAAGTATNGSATTEPTNLFDPADIPTDDLSDVYALSAQPSLAGTDAADDLLVISQQSGRIVELDRDGTVHSSLDIADAGAPLSVPDETHEGITMDRDGTIYTVNENGGGDADHPQLWVYAPTSAPRVAITEVAPGGSGTSYAADWFELTNTGSTPVDLTGWTMDDSSDAVATSVPLRGVTTLPAGGSAIFLESTATPSPSDATILAAFSQAWSGTDTPPSGVRVGYYGGLGVGLGGSGDAVNLFDATGAPVTGVSFGASTAGVTFDNTARLGAVAGPVPISTLSAEAVHGAYVGSDGEIGSPAGFPAPSTTPTGPPSVVVSEVAPWGSSASYAADWFELTNTGTTTLDLTGWRMDDSSAASATSVPLTGVTSLPAGASAIFLDDSSGVDATIDLAFTQSWYSLNTFPAGRLVGHYGGSGVGLSTGGDGVTIFDSAGSVVTGITFGAATANVTFDNAAGAGSATAPYPAVSTLSAVGVDGAFTAADGVQVGSPFLTGNPAPAPSVVVSEVAPWGSGSTSYAADWFELTNTGSSAVDLTGWTMDDNSDAALTAVALKGVASLPAGASAVFLDDSAGVDTALASAFSRSWFGTDTLPDGVRLGFYGGVGVGLSTGGDHVNIFDASGTRLTGVAFGASPTSAPFTTFDNTAGLGSATTPLPTISTASAIGVDGGFRSHDDAQIGSPAGVADTTAPVVTATASPAPNARGWNNGTVTVSYTCTDDGLGVDTAASSLGDDVLSASGTATGTCVDRAGNSATATDEVRIDTTAPSAAAITIDGPSGDITDRSVSFVVASSESDVVAFRCRLVGHDTEEVDCSTGYSASDLDLGSYTLQVRAIDRADNTSTVVQRSFRIVPRVFTATPQPTISGRVRVGGTLVADPGTWTPSTTGITFAYRWFADGTPIPGATGDRLALGPDLAGSRLSVQVQGSQDGFTPVTRVSETTARVAPGSLTSTRPTIAGTPRIGRTLTVRPGAWGPDGVRLTYRWSADGRAIPGATGRRLRLDAQLLGARITVTVTGRADGYATRSRTSAAVRVRR